MATQWTAQGISAGAVLPAATLQSIGAAWETWTPVWTASTTNPAIGNGFIGGSYCRINKTVIAEGYVIAGSTTTYGSGAYRISVPISPMISSNGLIGYATLFDASAGYISYAGIASQNTTSLVEFRLGAASNLFSPTVPVTMANADQFRFQLIYQAA
jgi:hypothetical protein